MQYWKNSERAQCSHPVLFDKLADLPAGDMANEAVDILIAGSDTTAISATTAIMEIIAQPEIEQKLTSALDASMPPDGTIPSLFELESIEYLVGYSWWPTQTPQCECTAQRLSISLSPTTGTTSRANIEPDRPPASRRPFVSLRLYLVVSPALYQSEKNLLLSTTKSCLLG